MAKKVVRRNERHWGISVLSILGYIGTVFTFLIGLLFIAGSTIVGTIIAKFAPEYAWMTGIGVIGLIFIGIIFIGFAILDFFIARGLWKGQNWARIFMLIMFALSALSALLTLEIASLVIDALIIWYLGFYKPVLNYFK